MKKGEFDLTGKAVDCSGLIVLGDAGEEIFRALKVACDGVDDGKYSNFSDVEESFNNILIVYPEDGYFVLDIDNDISLETIQPSCVLGQAAIDAAMDGATIVFEGDELPSGHVKSYRSDGSSSDFGPTLRSIAIGDNINIVAYKFLEEPTIQPMHEKLGVDETAYHEALKESLNHESPSIESRVLAEKVGSKHDQNKPRYDLIPPHAEAEFVDVLTFGATKYEPNQWKKVPEAKDRYTAAALRHLASYRMGESHDVESGKHHLAHAMCCLSFIIELDMDEDK